MRDWSLAVLVMTACGSRPVQGELIEADILVEREGARSLAADVSMLEGTLDVHGGDCALMDAKLRYDATTSAPVVDYAIDGQGLSALVLREEDTRPGQRADWTVCVSRDLPVDLDVGVGTGVSDIVLGGVQLRSLDVDVGAARVRVDLRESTFARTKIAVEGRGGNLHLRLPATVSVRVDARGAGPFAAEGLHRDGDVWVNDRQATGDASAAVQIDLGGGPATVVVE